MKHLATFLIAVTLLASCQQKKDKSKDSEVKTDTEVSSKEHSEQKLSLLQEIAYANGYEKWAEVDSISFTFNAQNEENLSQRTWKWKPKTGEVTMTTQDTTLTYKTDNFDDEIAFADRGFINDKYWLLFPFQLVWDENFDHKIANEVKAPISGELMQEIAIIYKNEAGYTPGDTYHIYVDDDMMIREWSYTPKGSDEPRLATTWEDYKDFNGIKIAKMHNTKEGNFKIFFTDISVN